MYIHEVLLFNCRCCTMFPIKRKLCVWWVLTDINRWCLRITRNSSLQWLYKNAMKDLIGQNIDICPPVFRKSISALMCRQRKLSFYLTSSVCTFIWFDRCLTWCLCCLQKAIFCNARFNLSPVAFIVAIQTGTPSGKGVDAKKLLNAIVSCFFSFLANMDVQF